MVRVNGGGPTGQAQAARMGIARALQNWDPTLRPVLKAAGARGGVRAGWCLARLVWHGRTLPQFLTGIVSYHPASPLDSACQLRRAAEPASTPTHLARLHVSCRPAVARRPHR